MERIVCQVPDGQRGGCVYLTEEGDCAHAIIVGRQCRCDAFPEVREASQGRRDMAMPRIVIAALTGQLGEEGERLVKKLDGMPPVARSLLSSF